MVKKENGKLRGLITEDDKDELVVVTVTLACVVAFVYCAALYFPFL